MKRMYVLAIVLGALTLTAIPRTASAQGHPQVRHGFWFSGGLGYGSLGCNDCSFRFSSLTGELSMGGTISNHVLLGAGMNSWAKAEDGVTHPHSRTPALPHPHTSLSAPPAA